jgi:hypothetical protein
VVDAEETAMRAFIILSQNDKTAFTGATRLEITAATSEGIVTIPKRQLQQPVAMDMRTTKQMLEIATATREVATVEAATLITILVGEHHNHPEELRLHRMSGRMNTVDGRGKVSTRRVADRLAWLS